MPESIAIEVVFALPEQCWRARLRVPANTTAGQAFDAARSSLPACPWPDAPSFGVYGKRCAAEHVLLDGERLEVYRALHIDPKDARRARAHALKRPR